MLAEVTGAPGHDPTCRDLFITLDVLYSPRVMGASGKDQALGLVEQMGLARPAELEARGVPRAQLHRLVRQGQVERRARGIYVAARHATLRRLSCSSLSEG